MSCARCCEGFYLTAAHISRQPTTQKQRYEVTFISSQEEKLRMLDSCYACQKQANSDQVSNTKPDAVLCVCFASRVKIYNNFELLLHSATI